MNTIISNDEGQWIAIELVGQKAWRVLGDNIREGSDPLVDGTELAIGYVDGLEVLLEFDGVVCHAVLNGVEIDFRDQDDLRIVGSARQVLEVFRQGLFVAVCPGDE